MGLEIRHSAKFAGAFSWSIRLDLPFLEKTIYNFVHA